MAASLALVLYLRLYDIAGVSAREAADAEAAASGIFAQAGIQLAMVVCGRSSDHSRDRCMDPLQNTEAALRLVRTRPGGDDFVLGRALLGTRGAPGQLAMLYIDRIRQLAQVGGTPSGVLLGRTMAHEVCHLLTGASSHSRDGLMRPTWSVGMLRAGDAQDWRFSEHDAARLRSSLDERLPAKEANGNGVVEWPTPTLPPCRRKLACTN